MKINNALLILIALIIVGFITFTNAADRRSYDVVVEPQKSDTVRMIEAYERLSDQYLQLVQTNLVMMAQNDQQIMQKLDKIEQKIDVLTKKIEALEADSSTAKPKTETSEK